MTASQETSPTLQFKSISSLALSCLYSPTLISKYDYWKTTALTREAFVGKVISLLFNMLSSVQLLSHVRLFETPWTAARQAFLFIAKSRRLLPSIESVMPSNHLILCHPLLLLPSIFPSIRVFSNESVLHIRCPKYWEFQLHHQSFQ